MLHKFSFKLFLPAILLSLSAICANAVTYTVTTTNDGGAGSLRDAVAAANGQTADDIINFNIPATDANCVDGVCRITLTSSEIVINATSATGKITITNQSGAKKLLISGNNSSRIFYINMGESEAVIDGITIISGGGFGATDPNVNGFGGGVYVKGLSTAPALLTISNSSFENNAASFGGGIYVTDSRLVIVKSAFISNGAQLNGGGIYNYGSALNIVNSTIHSNVAGQTGGGIYNYIGTTTITNTTIARNRANSNTLPGNVSPSGGIANFGDLAATKTYIRNTIVADNIALDAPRDIYHGSADTFVSNGNNLIGISNNTGTAVVYQPTDIRNQSSRLAPLGDNGGTTATMALLPDSPAVNAGTNCVLPPNGCGDGTAAINTDQRGLPRKSGATVDIGAYELQNGNAQFDFDGDGKADLSIFRANADPSFADFQIRKSSDNGLFGSSWGLPGDKLAPADYDGDGKTDVAVWRESEGKFYILNSSSGSLRIENFGLAGDVLMVGDYDGDGKADLATYRNGAQSTFFYRGSSNNPLGNITYLPWGTSGDKPLRGDFDGDGKMDAAVFRPSNGVWYILQSSNGQPRYDNFGLSTDKFVPADYDGDGKTDLAVYRSGVWYFKQSLNNQVSYAYFGVSSDTPVPADYNGDGKADIAVFRPSEGNWYVFQAAGNSYSVAQFGQTGDAPVPAAFQP